MAVTNRQIRLQSRKAIRNRLFMCFFNLFGFLTLFRELEDAHGIRHFCLSGWCLFGGQCKLRLGGSLVTGQTFFFRPNTVGSMWLTIGSEGYKPLHVSSSHCESAKAKCFVEPKALSAARFRPGRSQMAPRSVGKA